MAAGMTSHADLLGKVAFISGTSRGLGLGFARTLAAAGCDLICTSRTLESLEPVVAEITALGRRCLPVALDVRDHGSIQAAAKAALAAFPKIDILVNNAGCNARKPALEVTWEDWNLVLETNLRGSFFLSQALAPSMIQHGAGKIIMIGSVTCVAGYAGLAPYGASRGGIKQLTMSLASDWGPHGLNVNCLAPGWFKTEQNKMLYEDPGWVEYLCERIPLGRPGRPDDLEGMLCFLASNASDYITGQTFLVDGGISVGQTRATVRK